MGLVLDAQLANETTAWVTTTHSTFFPPDAATLGIDLHALVVIRAEHAQALGRAADHLARSGAFGLVVIDLCDASNVTLPMPLQSRLLGLAQKHRMALVVLSQKTSEQPSLSSLVSLRGQTQRRALSHGRFAYETIAIKDKQRAPGWSHIEDVYAPPGIR
jgi:recombination protein RecA